MNDTFYGCSIAAKAVSAVSNCFTFNEIAAKQAQSKPYLTKRHNFIAFSHLPFSQKSNKSVGYGDTPRVMMLPSFLLTVT
jgi:hypothetical protein